MRNPEFSKTTLWPIFRPKPPKADKCHEKKPFKLWEKKAIFFFKLQEPGIDVGLNLCSLFLQVTTPSYAPGVGTSPAVVETEQRNSNKIEKQQQTTTHTVYMWLRCSRWSVKCIFTKKIWQHVFKCLEHLRFLKASWQCCVFMCVFIHTWKRQA